MPDTISTNSFNFNFIKQVYHSYGLLNCKHYEAVKFGESGEYILAAVTGAVTVGES